MKVSILGTDYNFLFLKDGADTRLDDCDGFCDETTKEIVIKNYECGKYGEKGKLELQEKKNIRHEVIHAFLCESGLAENSPWAQNEEMVDWFAKQALKLMDAWREMGAL